MYCTVLCCIAEEPCAPLCCCLTTPNRPLASTALRQFYCEWGAANRGTTTTTTTTTLRSTAATPTATLLTLQSLSQSQQSQMSHQGLENYGLPIIVTYSFASDSSLQTADSRHRTPHTRDSLYSGDSGDSGDLQAEDSACRKNLVDPSNYGTRDCKSPSNERLSSSSI